MNSSATVRIGNYCPIRRVPQGPSSFNSNGEYSKMKVTKVEFHTISKPDSKLKAYANVEFDDTLVVKGFKVFDGQYGPFVKVPQEKNGEQYYDTVKWTDESYYKQGSPPHPVLQAITDAWKEHAGTGSSAPRKQSSGQQQAGTNKKQPW